MAIVEGDGCFNSPWFGKHEVRSSFLTVCRCNVKNEDLIPESFMKISSSSLDFHKNGVPNPAGENFTGALKTETYQSPCQNQSALICHSEIMLTFATAYPTHGEAFWDPKFDLITGYERLL